VDGCLYDLPKARRVGFTKRLYMWLLRFSPSSMAYSFCFISSVLRALLATTKENAVLVTRMSTSETHERKRANRSGRSPVLYNAGNG
jgi:hypothetical protein